MDKFPLMQDGRPVGELITEREALYTWYEARCRLPGEGLWCAWAVGDRGELRLGVLEPCGDRASIRRRFSAQLTGPVGRLQWGELRPAHPAEPGEWLPAERAGEAVAHALELPLGARVTRLVRLRHLEGYRGDAPVVYTTVYVPYKLFPDMDQMDFTDLSFYDVLARRGLEVRHASRRLEVVPPPAEVAARLGISAFEPVIFITSTGRTAAGQPVEYAESYYPAGSSSFLIEVHR